MKRNVFLLERKKRNRYIYISYTALCGNFKPNPLCQGKKKNIKEDDSYENQSKWQEIHTKKGDERLLFRVSLWINYTHSTILTSITHSIYSKHNMSAIISNTHLCPKQDLKLQINRLRGRKRN